MGVYSFLNVLASITGPGGSFALGSGSGAAKEGISVEMLEDKDAMLTGADGQIMHSLRGSNAGRVVVRLLKTSPVNAQLQQMYNFQRLSPGAWGQNVLVVSDVIRGDVVAGSEMAFVRQTGLTYSEDAGMNEWAFLGNINQELGTGVPDLSV